jgi:hypothetical protein
MHLRLGNHALTILTDAGTRLKPGDKIAIEPVSPLYFDAGGDRIPA